MPLKFTIKFGGEGSGNFGHQGRPGEIGGSGEGGGREDVKDTGGTGDKNFNTIYGLGFPFKEKIVIGSLLKQNGFKVSDSYTTGSSRVTGIEHPKYGEGYHELYKSSGGPYHKVSFHKTIKGKEKNIVGKGDTFNSSLTDFYQNYRVGKSLY